MITYAIDSGFWKGYIHQSDTIFHIIEADIPAPEHDWYIYEIAIYPPITVINGSVRVILNRVTLPVFVTVKV